MSKSDLVSSSRVEQAVLIVFGDLTRFMANSRSTPDDALAELLDGYYRHAEGLVSAAGGRVVKFMGDAFLAVWPEAGAGDGVEALPVLKRHPRVVGREGLGLARGAQGALWPRGHRSIRRGSAVRRDRERGQCRGDASGPDRLAVRGGVPAPRERQAPGVPAT